MTTAIAAPMGALVNPFRHYASDDTVTIRGRRLEMGDLVDPKLFDPEYVAAVRERVAQSLPFRHLSEMGWFNPLLLELAAEEFSVIPEWTHWAGRHQQTFRSPPKMPFGPASFLYFSIVNSGWFLDLMSDVMDVPDLIPDAQLHGGGLHESRNGGRFGIHRDFDRHARNRLWNRMSMITYLNKDWDPSWGGALELWDEQKQAKVCAIEPDFNRIVVLSHGPATYHGHPHPLQMPEGVVRRSLASYYYTNGVEDPDAKPPQSTLFLLVERQERLREAARNIAPPILWKALKWAFGKP